MKIKKNTSPKNPMCDRPFVLKKKKKMFTAFPPVCLPGAAVAFRAAAARRNGDEGRHQCQEGRHDVPQDLYSETRQCQVSRDQRPCFLRAAVGVDAQSDRARLAIPRRQRRHIKPTQNSDMKPNIVFLSLNQFISLEMRKSRTHEYRPRTRKSAQSRRRVEWFGSAAAN